MSKIDKLLRLVEYVPSSLPYQEWEERNDLESVLDYLCDVLNENGWAWVDDPMITLRDGKGIVAMKGTQEELESAIDDAFNSVGKGNKLELIDVSYSIPGAFYFNADYTKEDINALKKQIEEFIKNHIS